MLFACSTLVASAVLAQEGEQRAVPVRQDLQTVADAVQLFIYRAGGMRCNAAAQRSYSGLVQQLVDPFERVQAGQLCGGPVAVLHMEGRAYRYQRRVAQRGARKQPAHRIAIQMCEEAIFHLYPPKTSRLYLFAGIRPARG